MLDKEYRKKIDEFLRAAELEAGDDPKKQKRVAILKNVISLSESYGEKIKLDSARVHKKFRPTIDRTPKRKMNLKKQQYRNAFDIYFGHMNLLRTIQTPIPPFPKGAVNAESINSKTRKF